MPSTKQRDRKARLREDSESDEMAVATVEGSSFNFSETSIFPALTIKDITDKIVGYLGELPTGINSQLAKTFARQVEDLLSKSRVTTESRPVSKKYSNFQHETKTRLRFFRENLNPIERIVKDIEDRLSEFETQKGVHELDIRVMVDGETILLKDIHEIATQSQAIAPTDTKFDPIQAGKEAVNTMKEARGGSWTGAYLARHFDLTAATLHRRRTEYRIVYWRDAKNQFHYPKWQFNEAGALVHGIQDVLKIFRSSDEWRVMRYFLAPRHQLDDRAPLDLLLAGEVSKVVAHAQAHGEENSW